MKRYILLLICCASCVSNKPTERIEFRAPGAYPEGVAYNANRNSFYVSSMTTGSIGEVDRQGNYSTLYADSGLRSTYGLKMHPNGQLLYACVGDANFSKYTSPNTRHKMARLVIIDIISGQKKNDIDLSGLIPSKHFPNDMAFDSSGNVYITDSYAHAIYKVTPSGKASVFAKSTLFETEGVGLNGIVYHPNNFLLVNNSNTGRIYKVPLDDAAAVSQVAIEQYFLGADGMLLNNDQTLTMVVNGGNDKIFQLGSDDAWNSARLLATTLSADRFTYPATATMSGNDIWIMNARTSELKDSNAVPATHFAIQRAVLKPVPAKN